LIANKKAGAIFFYFTDAFGSVDRKRLLFKIGRHFGITGRLFLHLVSFLSQRYARIKLNGCEGRWIESILGTSAGTMLGPVLFILYMHDVPKCIVPKFADDLVTLADGESFGNVALELQNTVDQMEKWSKQWGMTLNVDKIKLMFFGRQPPKQQHYSIKLHNSTIEQVSFHCYLGVMLDQCLDFHLQVEKVVGKVKRTTNKVGMLFKERSGIPVKIATDLYKSLVRPHIDYAAPVCKSISK